MRVSADHLTAVSIALLKAMGVGAGEAKTVADNLVMAERRGIATHGVNFLIPLADRIKAICDRTADTIACLLGWPERLGYSATLEQREALVKRAAALGYRALALTDHGVMFGILHFYHAARKAGIKPIVGCEIYVAPRGMADRDSQQDGKPTHLLLLAENQAGYHNLMQIATAAQLEGFYYKPRVDRDFLAAHAGGLIALSSCGSGEVPRLLQRGLPERAAQAAAWYRDVFGPDGFFLELQEHDLPDMVAVPALPGLPKGVRVARLLGSLPCGLGGDVEDSVGCHVSGSKLPPS